MSDGNACQEQGQVQNAYPASCLRNNTSCPCPDVLPPPPPDLPCFYPPPTTTELFTTTPPITTILTTANDVTSPSSDLAGTGSTKGTDSLTNGTTQQSSTWVPSPGDLTNGIVPTDTTDHISTATTGQDNCSTGQCNPFTTDIGNPNGTINGLDATSKAIIGLFVCSLLVICIASAAFFYRKYKQRHTRSPMTVLVSYISLSVSPTEGIQNPIFDSNDIGGGNKGTEGHLVLEPHHPKGAWPNGNGDEGITGTEEKKSKALTEVQPATVALPPPVDVYDDVEENQAMEKEKSREKEDLGTRELPPLRVGSGRPNSDIAL